ENIGTELAPEPNRPVKDEQDNNLNVVSVAANDESNRAQDGETHKVYLTFDDGPSSNTAEILDLLAQYNVKATFFVVGKTDEESVAMYKRIVEEGHTLGMHSYSHKYSMIYDSLDNFTADFTQIQNYLYDVTGVDCVYYRFPGGSSNKVSNTDMAEFIGYLNDQGVTYFDWNVASGDATSQAYTAQDLVDNVMQDVVKYKTSVVLMHDADNKDKTVEALGMILEQLQEQGAEVLPIDSDTAVIQHISADVAQ
ncbi:MAG: polysaccharide deacetylase, partial [Lachnospiraceae bacterium]|nr:polysaccharide deacetylase [Lachnospiraceae bacterium]